MALASCTTVILSVLLEEKKSITVTFVTCLVAEIL